MFFSIWYSVDGGPQQVLSSRLPSNLVLYHYQDPDCIKRNVVDIVYRFVSENGKFPVGKIEVFSVTIN